MNRFSSNRNSKPLLNRQRHSLSKQKELMDTLEASAESAPANELAQKEDRVGEEFGKLSENLDELGTEMGELAENKENAPPQIDRLADEIKRLNQFTKDHNLPEDLEATSENLRSGQNRKALESGREAEQTLTELAQGLDNALEFYGRRERKRNYDCYAGSRSEWAASLAPS